MDKPLPGQIISAVHRADGPALPSSVQRISQWAPTSDGGLSDRQTIIIESRPQNEHKFLRVRHGTSNGDDVIQPHLETIGIADKHEKKNKVEEQSRK